MLNERRRLQRFSVRAFATVRAVLHDEVKVYDLYTRDISSSGAYLTTDAPLPVGVHVEIAILLVFSGFAHTYGCPGTVKVRTKGIVIRSGSDGMAVAFERRWKMAAVAGGFSDEEG